MKKEKFKLTTEMIDLEETNNTSSSIQINQIKSIEKQPSEKVTITMGVEKKFRTEFKSWCASNNITLVEAFKKGFKLLKSSK
jgi:hypothetical protein